MDLNIRNANIEDVDLLFKWSNNKLVRKQSFSSKKIHYKTHCKWFNKKLNDSDSFIYIVEVNNISSGVIRIDRNEKNATIAISIDEEFRGYGLGKIFLKRGLDVFFKKSNLNVFAYIKNDNIASIKSFENAGFKFEKEEEVNGIKTFIYQFKK